MWRIKSPTCQTSLGCIVSRIPTLTITPCHCTVSFFLPIRLQRTTHNSQYIRLPTRQFMDATSSTRPTGTLRILTNALCSPSMVQGQNLHNKFSGQWNVSRSVAWICVLWAFEQHESERTHVYVISLYATLGRCDLVEESPVIALL
jgi:hypothetical protein